MPNLVILKKHMDKLIRSNSFSKKSQLKKIWTSMNLNQKSIYDNARSHPKPKSDHSAIWA